MPEDLTTGTSAEAQRGTTAAITLTSPLGFELLDEVGRGGMGVVYRARDVALGRDVAVKVLADRYPTDSPAAQRFLSEARITGQLQHPGIPAVHQVGALADGRPFLAMKLIKGQTLEAILKTRDNAAKARGQLVAAFEAVCQAVGYAHAHQVIHRDIKPANVMVGAFGEVQVMDWGLAKVLGESAPTLADPSEAELTRAWTQVSPSPDSASHTQAGSVVGTPAFIAPEQALGEIEKVGARSDVFGLGALLAAILTGKPPYVGETAESVRVLAARGKLDDCFARLDASGADPELIALCQRCLAFEPADRPRDTGEVATAVAGLRSAAEERARTAERDKAAGEARAEEQRRKRRWQYAAAGLVVLALAGGVLGLGVYLRAQTKANADLAAKNAELAEEQAKVQARFDMAVKAIETFHTGVSEDALLKNPEFKELRTKLLKEAKRFYEELEKLLAGQSDAKSRKTLAAGYFQLAELTAKIGDQAQALAVHRKALAVRRELAAVPGADVETRLDVARSLHATGHLLRDTGDLAGALSAFQEERDLAAALEAESPTDAVRVQLAFGHKGIGWVLDVTGKSAEALDSYRQALAIYQKLPESGQYHDPGQGLEFGLQLQAGTHMSIGFVLAMAGKQAEGLESFRKASDIMQKLADANPANASVQAYLAKSYGNLGGVLIETGKPEEALEPFRKALAIWQKLVDVSPAVTEFRAGLCFDQLNMVIMLGDSGKQAEAMDTGRKAVAIAQKLDDTHPSVPTFQFCLGRAHNTIGVLHSRTGKPAEALEAYRTALPIQTKVVEANPGNSDYQGLLANLHNNIGLSLGRQRQFAEAFVAFEAGLGIRLKLLETDPQNVNFIENLFTSYTFRGSIRVRAGLPAEAAADLRRALELCAKVPHMAPHSHYERLRAQAILAGLGADAKSGVTKEEAKAFADQSVAALAALLKTGWADPGELKEPDSDALRGRADFQKLVAEVEAKAEKPAAKDK